MQGSKRRSSHNSALLNNIFIFSINPAFINILFIFSVFFLIHRHQISAKIVNETLKISIFSKFLIFSHFFDRVYSLWAQHFSYSNHIFNGSYFLRANFHINAKSSGSLSSRSQIKIQRSNCFDTQKYQKIPDPTSSKSPTTSIAGVNCQPSYPAWALSAEVHVTPSCSIKFKFSQ